MSKKKYWSDKEDILCERFVNTDDKRIELKCYKGLYPKIKMMAESVHYLYFNGNDPKPGDSVEDVVNETINHVFMTMNRYDQDKRGKNGWYSFIQTIVKNSFYNYYRPLYQKSENSNFINNKPDFLDKIDSLDNKLEDDYHLESKIMEYDYLDDTYDLYLERFEKIIDVMIEREDDDIMVEYYKLNKLFFLNRRKFTQKDIFMKFSTISGIEYRKVRGAIHSKFKRKFQKYLTITKI